MDTPPEKIDGLQLLMGNETVFIKDWYNRPDVIKATRIIQVMKNVVLQYSSSGWGYAFLTGED
jgi:hypothetical protein